MPAAGNGSLRILLLSRNKCNAFWGPGACIRIQLRLIVLSCVFSYMGCAIKATSSLITSLQPVGLRPLQAPPAGYIYTAKHSGSTPDDHEHMHSHDTNYGRSLLRDNASNNIAARERGTSERRIRRELTSDTQMAADRDVYSNSTKDMTSDVGANTDLVPGSANHGLGLAEHPPGEQGASRQREGRTWDQMGKDWWPPIAKLEHNAIGSGRWVIATSCSCGYIDMTYNWVLHLQSLNITRFLIFTEDRLATDFFRELLGECQVFSYPPGQAQPEALPSATWPSPEFVRRVTNRPFWMESIVRQNYGVIWSDSDQVWLQDVLPLLAATHIDVFLSVDSTPGRVRSDSNFCGGWIAVRPTAASLGFIRLWGDLLPPEGGLNQPRFNAALKQTRGLRKQPIDILRIQPGWLYFDDKYVRLRGKAMVAHANWITGHDNKRDKFVQNGLWRVPDIWTMPAACTAG
eukprot:jgi/Mesvir1/17370/Mv08677-RA.1